MLNTPYDDELLKRALKECAREPVHAPGAIQSHGALVSLDNNLRRVLQVSANIDTYLDVSANQALEMDGRSLLGTTLLRSARREIENAGGRAAGFAAAPVIRGKRRSFHVTAYRSDECLVLEFERDVRQGVKQMLAALSEMVMQLSSAKDVDTLLDMLVRHARKLSGDDRALAYRFVEEWHGMVVAEDRAPHVVSFLGQRFPAGEIPEQVRALYLRNPIRSIQDALAPAVPLIPRDNPMTGKPLDMGDGVLRAVSPVHAQYLQSMGNPSSHSIAIRSDKVLWGLLSMQTTVPKPLPPHLRNGLLVLTQAASQRLFLLEKEQDEQFTLAIHESRSMLTPSQRRLPEPAELLENHGRNWMRLFRACGVALVYHDTIASLDLVPSRDYMDALLALLRERASRGGVWYSDNLPAEASLPATNRGCCGVLAASLMGGVRDEGWLLIFRAEEPVVREWAGRPHHQLRQEGEKVVLAPRQSFDSWIDEVRGHSAPWRDIEVRKARDLAEDFGILVSALEISHLRDEAEKSSRELVRANERLDRIAHTDPLTELWNRRGIEESIETQLALAEREGRPFSIFLFDIDHFKRVNDTLGHPAGDRVLKRLAEIVTRELRRGDSVGRWGGEEFVFVASGADLDAAVALAERVRRCVEQSDLGIEQTVTVSVGVSSWHPDDGIESLIQRADHAVYEAKNSGRNCVRTEAAVRYASKQAPPSPQSRHRHRH